MTAWYHDQALLHGAVARALQGYKGQVASRWHIRPVGMKAIVPPGEDGDQDDGLDHACVGLLSVADDVISRRIDRLLALYSGDNLRRPVYVDFVIYMQFDVEDAAGSVFPLDMALTEGDGKFTNGFYAVVWNQSGEKVARCSTCGFKQTRIQWLDQSTLERFVPHKGLCPTPTLNQLSRDDRIDEVAARQLHREFFESSMSLAGLVVSYDDERSQLELLMAVAAKLSYKPEMFPKVVPAALLRTAKIAYLKDVGVPIDVWQAVCDFLPVTIYHDQHHRFRDARQW